MTGDEREDGQQESLAQPTDEEGDDRRWETAIAALMGQATIERAAAMVGISERTLRRWLANAQFQRAYREERQRVLAAASSRLVGLLGAATEALERGLTCGNPAVEARIALDVIKLAADRVRIEDLEVRLESLEREVGDSAGFGATYQRR
jgi:hypothetical protein